MANAATRREVLAGLVAAGLARRATADGPWAVPATETGRTVLLRDTPLARFSVGESGIHRPFLSHVQTTDRRQVTRTHPPAAGVDAVDHADMHPGIWMAFGDLAGSDFWRNKSRIRVSELQSSADEKGVRLAYTGAYLDPAGNAVCSERAALEFREAEAGWRVDFTSRFTAPNDFWFGDQEEMGLGVRLATPLTGKNGGIILNSAGGRGETGTWGKTADWCAYAGALQGRRIGAVIVPHSFNFRPSWFHTREYGLMVANPFGRAAFTKGQPSRLEVAAGAVFELRYRLHVFSLIGDDDAIKRLAMKSRTAYLDE